MAAAYLITLPSTCGFPRDGNVNSLVLWAHSEAAAKLAAKGYLGNDSNAVWDSATVTALEVPTDLEGWVFSISIAADPVIEVSYTALAEDTIDDVGAGLATALNATSIDNAGYTAGTNALVIAEGATDALGDLAVTLTATKDYGSGSVESPEMFSSIVDEGMSSADLSVVLVNAPSAHFANLK